MCTVTFLPLKKNDFIFTSNRDESAIRKTISPKKYIENGEAIIYPKDELAGGTWIGVNEKKRLVCLLNGGFKNHTKKEKYKHSRGLLVKELLTCNDAKETILNFNLVEVEPFTIIVVDWEKDLKLYELVWDEVKNTFLN